MFKVLEIVFFSFFLFFFAQTMLGDWQLEHLQGFDGHETLPVESSYEQQATAMTDCDEGLVDLETSNQQV